jgi:hypothetical protein
VEKAPAAEKMSEKKAESSGSDKDKQKKFLGGLRNIFKKDKDTK